MASTSSYETKAGVRYRARWLDPNGDQREKGGYTRKRDALEFAVDEEKKARRGDYVAASDAGQTLSSWAQEWEATQDWKDTTRQSWPPMFGRIAAVLGDPPIGRVRKSDMLRLRSSLMENYAHSTATITLSMAVKLLRDAHEDRRIPTNPGLGVRAPRARGNLQRIGPNDVPSTAEVLQIWQAAPDRFRAAIALGTAGLRVGEVLGLSADRVGMAAVLVDRQLQRSMSGARELTTPKAEKVRTVQLPAAVAREVRRHLEEHQGSGMLFRGGRSTGEPIRRDAFYVQAWRPALEAAGFDRHRFKFHSLRHWCASSMLAEGLPVTAVAAHIGDTVETLLTVYAHWLRDADAVPIDVLDRLLSGDSVPIKSPRTSLKLVDVASSAQ